MRESAALGTVATAQPLRKNTDSLQQHHAATQEVVYITRQLHTVRVRMNGEMNRDEPRRTEMIPVVCGVEVWTSAREGVLFHVGTAQS